jgi:hypothetical protein
MSLLLVLVPAVASAQSVTPSVSIRAAAGPTIVDRGHNVSAAVGFSPVSRVTLFVEVQRTQLSSRFTSSEQGSSAFRGGTMTAVSGEARVGLFPATRVTPYVLVGAGVGVSRPTVNDLFPDRVTNNARFVSFGGGVHVPLHGRLSLFGDLRMLIGVEAGDLLAIVPVRVGIGWRF